MKKFWLGLALTASVGVFAGCSQTDTETTATGEAKPEKIRLDYAYYSPLSLVIKEKGLAEEAFAEDGVKVEFVLSQGSNKALEFLNSNSVDFGSTAGAAALIAKSNGAPIEGVYLYSKPEWTALVVGEDSPIQKVEELKGKKVAATVGTDPYIFLLRALDTAGLTAKDIEVVPLQHGDGASALVGKQVDAWAGLDPHMARVELENNAKLFYRNPDFNTYGFLNVREDFAEKYPTYVEKVLQVYENARLWAIEHPDETAEILAKEAKLSSEVAKKELERNDFTQAIPGDTQRETILEAGKVLQNNEIIKPDVQLEEVIDALIEPTFAEKVVKP